MDKTNNTCDCVKISKCNYCKNHDIDQDYKNHGKCPFNNKDHFKKCKRCRMNHKKSDNVKKYRERIAKKDKKKAGSDPTARFGKLNN